MNGLIKGLVRVSQTQDDFNRWSLFFERLLQVLDHTSWRQILTHPSLTKEMRLEFLEDSVALNAAEKNLLQLMVQQKLIYKAKKLLSLYKIEYLANCTKIFGVLYSSQPLSEKQHRHLETQLTSLLKKSVHLDYKCDPNIIGVRVHAGNYSYSMTLEDVINKMKFELLRG